MAPQRDWFEKDYYAVLGLTPDASDKDVQKAYRKLAKENHPDTNPGDAAAEERFKEASAAHEVLGDPEKRKEYDSVREMVASGGPAGFGGSGFGGAGFGGPGYQGGGFDFDDAGGFGDILGNLFGGGFNRRGRGRAGTAGPVRGHDLETELHVDFLDAVHGVTTTVNVTSDAACSTCGGSGAEPGTFPVICTQCNGTGAIAVPQGPFSVSEVCPTCGGRGQIIEHKCKACRSTGVERRRREVKVRLPAGVRDGQRIRVKGRGAVGRNGGPPGDLYVVVHVAPHAVFGRSGKRNLTVEVPITFAEAALGAHVKVPTLGAPVTVKVPAGTQHGTTVRVRGRGIAPTTGDPGDLLVTFTLVVPEQLTADQKDAIEALAEAIPTNPRLHLDH